MDQTWYTRRDMVGQQPRQFSITQLHLSKKYCKKFFWRGGGTFFTSHCGYELEAISKDCPKIDVCGEFVLPQVNLVNKNTTDDDDDVNSKQTSLDREDAV